jgi:hypothetical protein
MWEMKQTNKQLFLKVTLQSLDEVLNVEKPKNQQSFWVQMNHLPFIIAIFLWSHILWPNLITLNHKTGVKTNNPKNFNSCVIVCNSLKMKQGHN